MANQTNVALLTQDPGNVPQTTIVMAGGGPTSQRPANPAQWFHYYDTDLGRDVIWSGSTWIVTAGGPMGPQGPQGGDGPSILSGPTSMRPSNPSDYQRYYDTDIHAEIWWERGAWRTVAGTQGDIKFVSASSEGDAITKNPGWVVIGDGLKGRVPVFSGSGFGLSGRNPGDSFGSESVALAPNQVADHFHVTGRFRASNSPGNFSDDYCIRYINSNQAPDLQNPGSLLGLGKVIAGELNSANYFSIASQAGEVGVTNGVETIGFTANGQAHGNVQPSYALVGLVKE